ncbi:MAG: Fis family transcriptional regulator [Gammaproteobacteria bacterium]|nr:MAG: Fis family transcriptional regulator [Gammaproteobacteria bacterium]
MIREPAIVVSVQGDRVRVETLQKSACGHCAARSECPNGALADMGGQRTCQIEATGLDGLSPGDRVEIGLQEETLLGGAFTLYLVPLAGLVAGAGLAAASGLGEGGQLVSGVLGLAAGLGWARRCARRAQPDDLMPRILRRL